MAGHRVGGQGAARDHAGGGSRLTEVSCAPFPQGTRSPPEALRFVPNMFEEAGGPARARRADPDSRIDEYAEEDLLACGGPVAAFAVAVMWWVAVRVS